jgi:hypothetical protein
MRIEDISPRDENTTLIFDRDAQSVSGRALCCAISATGSRAYLGGHSGVWRSNNGGLTWIHSEFRQPRAGRTAVPGALRARNVYDLAIAPGSDDLVLAAAGRDARRPAASGIYRSTDGARSWTRVHSLTASGSDALDATGTVRFCPDDPQRAFAVLCADGATSGIPGSGVGIVARSTDGGATWANLALPAGFSRKLWHVGVGTREQSSRRIYALGEVLIASTNEGNSWIVDPMQPINPGAPADAAGASAQSLGVHPQNPSIVYILVGDGQILLRGQFPPLPTAGPAMWTQLATPRKDYSGTTASGGGFVVPHVTPEGQLYLIVSDRRTTHICAGEPATQADWHRIEDSHCHLDPHGFAMTPEFRPQIPYQPKPERFGRALLINDGGANVSVDGGRSWINGTGLSTLDVVNVAVNAAHGTPTTICIGTGDNRGFSSRNGATSWKTQHYDGGDNDCCFADPFQPSRLVVFAPRYGPEGEKIGCLVYSGEGGAPPNVDWGTQQFTEMQGPPFLGGPDSDPRRRGHNLVSFFCGLGYRPLIRTRAGEAPRLDGDLVLIRFTRDQALLLRTTHMSSLSTRQTWVTNATSELQPALTFQQGPPLPDKNVCTVQASGGHDRPVYYVGDQLTGGSLWKWTEGMSAWKRIIRPIGPEGGLPGPSNARRYFVDPYRPALVYVLADNGVWRSDDGGEEWVKDAALAMAISENGAYPMNVGSARITDGTPNPVLLRDMQFDPFHSGMRFAIGPAGVFQSLDGKAWSTLLNADAISAHPSNAFYDPLSCPRILYLATYERGLLRLAPLPPDWDFPMGSLQTAIGRITFLRVHDVGGGFGPPHDRLDAEVIVLLDSEAEKAFGLKLRPGPDARAAKAMLGLLRDAFRRNAIIRLEFFRSGCRTGTINRIIET